MIIRKETCGKALLVIPTPTFRRISQELRRFKLQQPVDGLGWLGSKVQGLGLRIQGLRYAIPKYSETSSKARADATVSSTASETKYLRKRTSWLPRARK